MQASPHHSAYVDRDMARMQARHERMILLSQKCRMFHSWHLASSNIPSRLLFEARASNKSTIYKTNMKQFPTFAPNNGRSVRRLTDSDDNSQTQFVHN